MTDPQGTPKLVLKAEALVAGATLREPDWEALAKRVEGALSSAGRSDDSLLLPPLPETVEDERLATSEAPTEPASASLAELARAAVARREAREAVSLAKESLGIVSPGRAPGETSAKAPVVTERERRTLPPARTKPPAFDTRGPWLGVAVAAMGLAAGFGLYLAGRNRAPEIIQMPVAEVAPPTSPAAPAKVHTESPIAAPLVTPDMLPAERGPSVRDQAALAAADVAREASAAKSGGAVSDAPKALSDSRSPAPSAGAAKAEKVVLEEEQAPASTPNQAQPSKPGTTPGLKPAELNANEGVPDRPSTGAAQAAVGAVLGAARGCLAGQPQGSSATLVFGSSGEVQSVSVSGPAEGTPAASCIQSALKKARVQPFAAPSFSLGVTVRPP